MNKTTLVLAGLLLPFMVFAQSLRVTGTVIDGQTCSTWEVKNIVVKEP